MRFQRFLNGPLLLTTAFLIQGCSMSQYKLAGNFEETGQQIYGELIKNPITFNISTLKMAINGGNIICEGDVDITDEPSGYTDIGRKLRTTIKCPNGQVFKIDLVQTSKYGGHGRGIDGNGNAIQFYFDETMETAKSRLEVKTLKSLVK